MLKSLPRAVIRLRDRHRRRRTWSTGVWLCLTCPWLAAGSATATEPDSVDYAAPVTVITATRDADAVDRLPLAVSTVGRSRFGPGEKGLSLSEALREVPGLAVAERNNPAQGPRLLARGLGARTAFGVRGMKVLLDGVPLTTPDGQTQIGNIDLATAGWVEVLRGPSSSLYGNAGGGVISVHTALPSAEGLRLDPRLLFGSDGLRQRQATVSGMSSRHRYTLSVRQLDADGYRHHSEARVRGLNAVVHSRVTQAWELVTVLNLYDAPYLLNPSSLTRADARQRPRFARGFIVSQGASKTVRQSQGGLTLRHTSPAEVRTEVTVYGVSRTLDNAIPGAVIDLDRLAGGVRAVHSRPLGLGQLSGRWKVGLDVEVQSDDRVEFVNEGLADPATDPADVLDAVVAGERVLDQEEDVRNVAPFAGVDVEPLPGWVVSLGGRLDRYRFETTDGFLSDGDDSGDRSLSQLSPAVAISYRWRTASLLYATYGTAFQTPTTVELSNRPDGSGGFNPDLDPESIVSYELGARGTAMRQHLAYDVALYRMRVDDMLLPFQVDDVASEAIYYRNAGQTTSWGGEVALSARLGRWRGGLAYTYMDFTFDDYVVRRDGQPAQLSGNQVPGLPPHRLVMDVRADLPRRLRAELETELVDAFYANDFNGPPPGSDAPRRDYRNDGYATVAVRLGVPMLLGGRRLRGSVGVDNLLDSRYNGSVTPNAFGDRFFEPASGRTWHLVLEAELGDS